MRGREAVQRMGEAALMELAARSGAHVSKTLLTTTRHCLFLFFWQFCFYNNRVVIKECDLPFFVEDYVNNP